jgi:hypothetical protein
MRKHPGLDQGLQISFLQDKVSYNSCQQSYPAQTCLFRLAAYVGLLAQ